MKPTRKSRTPKNWPVGTWVVPTRGLPTNRSWAKQVSLKNNAKTSEFIKCPPRPDDKWLKLASLRIGSVTAYELTGECRVPKKGEFWVGAYGSEDGYMVF